MEGKNYQVTVIRNNQPVAMSLSMELTKVVENIPVYLSRGDVVMIEDAHIEQL